MNGAFWRMRKTLMLTLILSVGLSSFGCGFLKKTVSAVKKAKAITEFSITLPVEATGEILPNYTINVTVPSTTSLHSMIATFSYAGDTVTVDGVEQKSGETPNDFTNPLTYRVTAFNGTTQDYVVTVSKPETASSKDITSFRILSPAASGTISGNDISVTVPYGTDRSSLVASFIHNGVSVKIGTISQKSGYTSNNFTSPVTYSVADENGATKDYTVTVINASDDSKLITSFNIVSPYAEGVIDDAGETISVTVPYGTGLDSLIAAFTTTGQSVTVGGIVQQSGVTENNFTASVTYVVTAYDTTVKNYTVTVVEGQSTACQMTSFSFATPSASGSIDPTAKTVSISVPTGSDRSNLVATFVVSPEAAVTVGSDAQQSGTTPNDFTNPVVYTVTAQDGTTTNEYTVTVTEAPASTGNDFLAFSLDTTPVSIGSIDTAAATVNINVPVGASLDSLVATFTVSQNAAVKIGSTAQISGTTANDFNSQLTYTVTSQSGAAKEYIVTAKAATVTSTWTNPACGYSSYLVEAQAGTDFNYEIDLGSSTKDVYFVFTNTSTTADVSNPAAIAASLSASFVNRIKNVFAKTELRAEPIAQRGTPEISEFNRDPFKALGLNRGLFSASRVSALPESPLRDAVNDTHVFMYNSTSATIPSTCRKVVSSDGWNLYIYVANDSWTAGGTKVNLVTQAMVDVLAGKFLKSGNQDIFHWVRGIFGAHWGASPYSNTIGDTKDITILLYDIDNDDSISGGTCGFFWSKDLFKTLSYSNQRVMFYIDSVMYATADETTWKITDYWPSTMVSTLAHEFQHMIHSYQKTIVNQGSNSDTWINEMCSMAAEDLIADKMLADGPRGVLYSDPTAGSAGNYYGRLPRFIFHPEWPVVSWAGELSDYSTKYAIGAYYGRNYDGANFFGSLVRNSYTDYRAVEQAIAECGGSDQFATTLRKWFVAMLLSDKTDTTAGYQYNKGAWFTSSMNSIDYHLGSINLFKYRQVNDSSSVLSNTGPVIETSPLSTLSKSSSYIYHAGTAVTGKQTWKLNLKPDVKMSVVVK
jgi:hypothetical protein